MTADASLIKKFSGQASRAGAIVHVSETDNDAVDYILSLVQEHGIKLVIISNSGMADRIKLSPRLEFAGINILETSVVQSLSQLVKGKDVPFSEVALQMSIASGRHVNPDKEEIMAAAKLAFKELYSGAGLGITEADFGIAENGTTATLENEGHARLASILPILHLTLLDANRIASSLSEATDIIGRSSGGIPGYKIPAFINYLTRKNTKTNKTATELSNRSKCPAAEYILILNLR
jgi:L-lactate utilization protein LutB